MSKHVVAAVQMDCRFGDKAANLDAVREKLREAAGLGASLVVFPECIVTGYGFHSKDEAMPLAEPIPGPSVQAIAGMCRESGVHAVVGLLEVEADRLFNVAVLVGPDGLVASYRKVHLPFLGVDRFAASGTRPFAVHEVAGLRVGMLICYDGSFPEASRCLMLEGADLIVLPTNWPTLAANNALLIPAPRALENQVYFAAVNRIGTERGMRFCGTSSIAAPTGDLLAKAPADEPAILTATLHPELARAKHIVRIAGEYEVDRLQDRRPEMYGRLTKP